MTRSIFDPDGGETLQQGSRNMGPSAADNSHMPPRVVDGKLDEEEQEELDVQVDLSENAPERADVEGVKPGEVRRGSIEDVSGTP